MKVVVFDVENRIPVTDTADSLQYTYNGDTDAVPPPHKVASKVASTVKFTSRPNATKDPSGRVVPLSMTADDLKSIPVE